jgi:AcrR family transcriptional regulator
MEAGVVLGTEPAASDSGRRLRRDAEENRRKILVAARELFADRGLETTLDAVAAHAGVGIGTVYRRYPSRDELVEVLFDEAIDELTLIARQASKDRNPWEALVFYLENICARLAHDRGLRELLVGSCQPHTKVTRTKEALEPMATDIVEAARAGGYLRSDFDDGDLKAVFGMVLHIVGLVGEVRPDLWRRYLALLLDGMSSGNQTTLPSSSLTTAEFEAVDQARSRAVHHG